MKTESDYSIRAPYQDPFYSDGTPGRLTGSLFYQVQETWYQWYQISSAIPECLASELYPDVLDLPILAKLSSALLGLKLVR
jgi:hypothetical protein